MANFVVLPVQGPLKEHDRIVKIDVRRLVSARVHECGFQRKEPSDGTIVKFVAMWDKANEQEKIDMIMERLLNWPLLVTRAMERIKDMPIAVFGVCFFDRNLELRPPDPLLTLPSHWIWEVGRWWGPALTDATIFFASSDRPCTLCETSAPMTQTRIMSMNFSNIG